MKKRVLYLLCMAFAMMAWLGMAASATVGADSAFGRRWQQRKSVPHYHS